MAIVAPYSKHRKGNLKIFIIVLLAAAGIFAYDGYLSKYDWSMRSKFYEKQSQVPQKDADGKVLKDESGEPILGPSGTMVFNRKSPPFFLVGAIVLAVVFSLVKNKKITAEENELTDGKKTVKFDAIEKIDKTHFKGKGYFVLYYKDQSDSEQQWKITDREYDNLAPLLDEIVAKIS